jgi:glucose-1-phosphate cytidylyltransferase
VRSTEDGYVTDLGEERGSEFLVNGGFFVLGRRIFDYIKEGEELVEEPFSRLAKSRLLGVYKHPGFWRPMDTFKDKITFDRMEAKGDCPWMLWRQATNTRP